MQAQLMEGVTALIAGMGTVFAILVLISVIISLFKYINVEKEVFHEMPVKATGHSEGNQGNTQTDGEEMNRVIAAITIALATQLNVSTDRFVVRDIRRL